MTSPLKRFHIGRFHVSYWHGLRFWHWLPKWDRHWLRGEMHTWRWLCFDCGWDGRKDVWGDLADPERAREQRRRKP